MALSVSTDKFSMFSVIITVLFAGMAEACKTMIDH